MQGLVGSSDATLWNGRVILIHNIVFRGILEDASEKLIRVLV